MLEMANPNPSPITEYDKDFHGWLAYNAELLKAGRIDAIDAVNLAEELDSMGKKQQRELINRLKIVLLHLLKWPLQTQAQAQYRSRSWNVTLLEQRQQLAGLFEESPSLRHDMESKFNKAYAMARKLAAAETGLPLESFPKDCPYRLEQVFDEEFYS